MKSLLPMLGWVIALGGVLPCARAAGDEARNEGMFPVTAFGAKGDGVSDDTAAIQKAVDAAAKLGGIVTLGAGKFLVAGNLAVPGGVTVRGINARPLYIEPQVGTILLATAGRDNEDAPPLFKLNGGGVEGVTIYYPEQKPTDIHPYPWTFQCVGGDDTI